MTLNDLVADVLTFFGIGSPVAVEATTRAVRALLAGLLLALLDGGVRWLQGDPSLDWRLVLAGALIGVLTGIGKALRDVKGWGVGV